MSDVFARIQKLLALQESRGATEAEAAIAAAHVQRLLQEHNLSLAQVEQAAGTTDKVEREKAETTMRAAHAWTVRLMEAVSENQFCMHRVSEVFVAEPPEVQAKIDQFPKSHWAKKISRPWTIRGERIVGHYEKRHVLVGRPLNVRVSLETYGYLRQAIRRAADDAGYKPGPGMSARTINDFRDGVSARLVERLNERRREAERESAAKTKAAAGNGTHRELVLTDVYGTESDQNNDLLNGFPVGTTAARRRKSHERSAEIEAKCQALVAQGVEATEAFYLAHGYDAKDAKTYASDWNRRQSRRRGGRGRSQGFTTADRESHRKVNSNAYQQGRKVGNQIGLDDQVGASSTRRIGSK